MEVIKVGFGAGSAGSAIVADGLGDMAIQVGSKEGDTVCDDPQLAISNPKTTVITRNVFDLIYPPRQFLIKDSLE